jgi:hydroxymethylpyrimidine pyrophosphatase-like HAD family hydrolase
MFYHALASDYDGTLAHNGLVGEETLAAVERLKQTGRKFILVTGRELDDLQRVFDRLDICDAVVAENGALLYMPASEEEKPIAPTPPPEFVAALQARGVSPLSVGHSIVATWEPNETIVLETIKDMGLELEIIFNKGAVMVLPSGVNKATGLAVALQALRLSPQNVIGIGDAENDHAFLRACGLSVAVDNALPAVKAASDLVTRGARGAGVEELVDRLVADEAQVGIPARHHVAVGRTRAGAEVSIAPGAMMLIAGSSGIGKSTLATALTELLVEKGFQFLIFDPEGDYEGLENAVVLGDAHVPPQKDDVLELLADPRQNVVVNTLCLELAERPGFFSDLQSELGALRARTGRPHWLMVDEAHHLLPRARDAASLALGQDMPGIILITVHPESVSADALQAVDMVVALGPQSDEVISRFCAAIDEPTPKDLQSALGDDVLVWRRGNGGGVLLVTPNRPRQVHKRHTRKYAEGDLGPEKSFYFRGPEDALNLRAQNLKIFVQLAEGLDDATWEHHLRAGDYSNWLGSAVKDDDLAEEAAAIEADKSLSAAQSRRLLAEAIRKRYTAPASA